MADSLAINTRKTEAGDSREQRWLWVGEIETAEGLGPADWSSLESAVSTVEGYVAGGWGESKTHNKPLLYGGGKIHTPNTTYAESGNTSGTVRSWVGGIRERDSGRVGDWRIVME